jgi:NADH dehydrogenase/putative oxidoreductase
MSLLWGKEPLLRLAIAWSAGAAAGLAGAGQPWVLLGIRLCIAQSFLVLHVMMVMGGHSLGAALSAGWWAQAVYNVAGSGFGIAVAALCPLLLAAGLLSRPAAMAMIVQAAALRMPGETPVMDAVWAGLLLAVVVMGPGRWSVDAVLAPGLRNSALPFCRSIPAFYHRLTQLAAPLYLFGVRLAMAGTMVAPHLAAASFMRGMAMHYLPTAPGLVRDLPAGIAIGGAVLMATGLFVRPLALALLLLAPLGPDPSATATRLFVILLLGVLLTSGGGGFALDRLLVGRLRRMMPRGAAVAVPHVVIVGGGFGGVAAAAGLTNAECRITLIDRHNYHLFQPLLYQVATAGLSPADIATPIRAMFRGQANLQVRLGDVTGVDMARREVVLAQGRIAYDTLIVATGARHSYFGHPEWGSIAPGLKTIDDATAIRRRLLLAFETAETLDDAAERAAWLTFVVIGGGPTGVELAGAIAELARFGMAGEFRSIDPATAHVVLVHSGPLLLPSFPPRLSQEAALALQKLGVDVRLGATAEAVERAGLMVGGAFLPARTILWAAGVMASPVATWLMATSDRAGRVVVKEDLTLPGHPEIFVVGDTAASSAWAGNPVPGLAPAAKQSGAYAARVVRARLRGRPPPPAFRYRHFGSLATIGRREAVAEFGQLRLSGPVAWWLWGVAHILFLVGGRNRFGVALEWLWDYLTLRRGIRLITGAGDAAVDS